MDLQNLNNNSTEGLSEADASLMNEALIPTQLTFEPESSVYELAAAENDYINGPKLGLTSLSNAG